MYYVYILKSEKDGGYYIGCTKNLSDRLARHNSGETPSLKNRRPFKIVYTEKYSTAEAAYSREKKIKSYKGGEAFKKLIENTDHV